ncbi:hypothetical protein WR25_08443 [Diploscapter pachys]|uniref:Uncharacterized protein n=1 Tax=Diploscapter pachys TaxID=2018661 RepID=A0A2A2K6Z6_9BILA|nr:hypothetical protein WR25_08443 [Diploscapter pachys]
MPSARRRLRRQPRHPALGMREGRSVIDVQPVEVAAIDHLRPVLRGEDAHALGERWTVEPGKRIEERLPHREHAGVVAVVRLQLLADRDDPLATRRDAGDVERIDPGMPQPPIDAEPQPLPRTRAGKAPVVARQHQMVAHRHHRALRPHQRPRGKRTDTVGLVEIGHHRQHLDRPVAAGEMGGDRVGAIAQRDDHAREARRRHAVQRMVDQRPARDRAQRLVWRDRAQAGALTGGKQQARRDHQAALMKSSTAICARSSVIWWRGCLQKYAEAGSMTPAMPRSLAIAAQRIMSIATPAEFGESSTDRRSSRFIGTPPNSWPSMRRKQTLLSFCQGT